jgi:hypothetical protein
MRPAYRDRERGVTPLGIIIPLALLAATMLVFLVGGIIADAIYTGHSWARVVGRQAVKAWRMLVWFVRGR